MTNRSERLGLEPGSAKDQTIESLIAQHEAWFIEQRALWRANHPPPVTAWGGNELYRLIQVHNKSFLKHIRPLADVWWAERGFKIDWSKREPIIHTIEVQP